MRAWPRLWSDVSLPVTRHDYLRHGLALLVLKVVGDAGLVWGATGKTWLPVDYLRTVRTLLDSELAGAPGWLLPAMVAWTLPFLWIGISLTIRRTVDAGRSPWWAVFFFVPWINYLLMAVLTVLPSQRRQHDPDARAPSVRSGAAYRAVGAGVAIGLSGIAVWTVLAGAYTMSLFLGVPFLMGAVAAWLFNRDSRQTGRATFALISAMFVAVGGLAVLFALEGLVCIAMAFPLALSVGMLGAGAGVLIADVSGSGDGPRKAFPALLFLPVAALLEPATPARPPVREVITAIVVDAPADVVWRHVVAFDSITAAPGLLDRLGIAYPVRARIDGEGVGAIRYCEFSTGAFVEPVAVWEPGRRLAFDVIAAPRPLRELSPWGDLAPPHLEGYLASQRGEFRLVSLPGGGTRLEGSTWYHLSMAPRVYWRVPTDWLIHRIHRRVLEHIRDAAEREATTRVG